MRVKKRIRQEKSRRTLLGIILMIVSTIMLLVGYLAHEYNLSFVKTLKTTSNGNTILTVFYVIWFAVTLILFIAGIIVIAFRKVRHHDYVERPYSSRV